MPPSLGTEPINYTRVGNVNGERVLYVSGVGSHLFVWLKVTN